MDLTIASQKSPLKKNGCMSPLQIAAFFIRRGSTAKKALIKAEAKESRPDWKVLVGGVRPFHHVHQLESSVSPKPPPMNLARNDSFHDVLLPPPSPPEGSIDSMSRYASAEDLCSLDNSKEDEAAVEDGDGMPNAIDLKAEEFIAKFYEQIKRQRLEYSN